MCKHLLNAQVSIRYYNSNWYDCPLCFFEEVGDYPDMTRLGTEMVFACKKCKKCDYIIYIHYLPLTINEALRFSFSNCNFN